MSAIKKFFQKRKLDIKFKKAGGGHALNEEPKASRPSDSRGYQAGQATSPRGPGEEARRAAEAALARQTSREKDRQGIYHWKAVTMKRFYIWDWLLIDLDKCLSESFSIIYYINAYIIQWICQLSPLNVPLYEVWHTNFIFSQQVSNSDK